MPRVNPYFERDKKKVMRQLKKMYKEKNRDFTFKARYLSKFVGINSHMVGCILKKIPSVEIYSQTAGIYIYKTCFNEGG